MKKKAESKDEYPISKEGKDEYPISNTERPMMKERRFDLQDRFIDFAVKIIKLSETIPENKTGKHICSQLMRSGTSSASNYGEAQSAESKADFIHKIKIALKELRETEIWLKIIKRAELIKKQGQLTELLKETDELISILFKSIDTVRKNKERT